MSASFRIGGYQGERSVLTRAMDGLARELDRLVGGVVFDMDATTSGTTARALFDGVETGAYGMCYMASGYLTARVPSLAVLDLPFSVTDRQAAYAALDGEAGHMLRRDVEASTGYRVLGFWDNGFRHVSNRRHPIRGIGDCRGLVIRTLDNAIYREVLAAMGFVPRSIDVRDFRAAVRDGEVDAQENPLTNMLNFGIERYHRFVSLTGHFFGVALLLCHRRWFDALSPDIQARLREAALHATGLQRSFAEAEDVSAIADLRRAGVDVVAWHDLDRSGFEAACRPVAQRVAAGLSPDLRRAYLGSSA
jgi:TRAP-type C4-dicarboxylate transport system substrate-binding protein